MKPLILENTKLTPYVNFNPEEGHFEISGYSRPENVRSFYTPLINYIDNYQRLIEKKQIEAKDLTFIFKFTYINSSSSKFLCELLAQVERFKKIGISFSVDWFYEEHDEDMFELGKDISNIIKHKFNYCKFENEGDSFL